MERISQRLAPLPARLPMSWSWDCLAGPRLPAEFWRGGVVSSAGPAQLEPRHFPLSVLAGLVPEATHSSHLWLERVGVAPDARWADPHL